MSILSLNRPQSARPPRVRRLALWRSRRALERLDAHLLRDIGLTKTQALQEARRGLWDAPSEWFR